MRSFRSSEAVFTGVALTQQIIDNDPQTSGTEIIETTFRVDKRYKGRVRHLQPVRTQSQGAACGVHVDVGERYTVFAYDSQGELWTGLCSGTRKGELNEERFGLTPIPTTFGGAHRDDNAGSAVAGIGDINSDGHPDFLVGAPKADPNGMHNAGTARVVYGRPHTGNVDLRGSSRGYVIQGEKPGDRLGRTVAAAGDVNGDGVGDIIVGAPHHNNESGAAYVLFRTSEFPIDLRSQGDNGFRIDGAHTGDSVGYSVAPAGDVNGDGFDDVIVGAPHYSEMNIDAGAAFVIYGKASREPVALSDFETGPSNDIGYILAGSTEAELAGWSVASSPDINGDGRPEMLVGAPGAGKGIAFGRGAVYVAFEDRMPLEFDSGLDPSGSPVFEGFKVLGADGYNGFGWSVASAGDAYVTTEPNSEPPASDRIPDLVVGAPFADGTRGHTYIFSGAQSAESIGVQDTNPTIISGARHDDWSGYSVAGVGDVNGDGLDDIVTGAASLYVRKLDKRPGKAYVVYGGGGNRNLSARALSIYGYRISVEDGFDRFGYSVAGAGDVNDDGFADLVVGAPFARYKDRPRNGAAYLFF